MEEKYWKQFMKTGRIVDYLYYRGMKDLLQSHGAFTEEDL